MSRVKIVQKWRNLQRTKHNKRKADKFIKDHRELYEEIQEHIQYLVVLRGYKPTEVHPPLNKHSIRLAARFIMSSIYKHVAADW